MTPFEILVAASGAEHDSVRIGEHSTLVGRCPVCDHAKSFLMSITDDRASCWCVMNHGACSPEAILDRVGLAHDVVLDRFGSGGFEIAHDLPRLADTVLGIEVLDRAALASLPEPEPLILETLDRRSVALLAGPPGSGKSFVALGWAASVATGQPWLNRTAEPGRVLYVVGEGAFGLHSRLSAWEEHNGVTIDPERFQILPAAVQVSKPDALAALVTYVEHEAFDLVVFDTLARMAVGVDENSADGMGRLVQAFEDVKRAMPRGTVLVVHHTGKDGETVRGSSSLEGAMDTVYRVEGSEDPRLLKRTKRKDGPVEDVIDFRLQPTGDSCVVLPTSRLGLARFEADPRAWHAGWTAVRLVFHGKATFSRAEAVAVMRDAGISRTRAYEHFSDLIHHEVIRDVTGAKDPKGFRYVVQDHVARSIGVPIPERFALTSDATVADLASVVPV